MAYARSPGEICREMEHLARVDRRVILQAGVLGMTGLAGWPWLAGLSGNPGGGAIAGEQNAIHAGQESLQHARAKRCIFLFMWGGPSQLDTFDPKPDASDEIRGEFRPISTQTPGLQFCEHFRSLAQHTNKLAVIRSLSHDDPAHLSSGHTTVTGQLPPVNKSDAEPPSEQDSPHIGCVMSLVRPAAKVLPSFVMMPWKVSHPAAPGGRAPGQHGGWLGHEHDPFLVAGDPNSANWRIPSLSLTSGCSLERMEDRRRLLAQLDQARRHLDDAAADQATYLQQRAFQLLASSKVRTAFDLAQEPAEVRDRFGRNVHGQCVLLARRLIEHEVPVVTVNWHDDGRFFWDTHGNNFARLKHDLIPPADQALSALLEDLDARGLLSETLVVWVGEFGRKPWITKGNAGREHWPYCYSGLMAGGGIQGGAVYGASDRNAAYPIADPVSPHDLVATIYHALGVPSNFTVTDPLGRPRPIYGGRPLTRLFA